VATASALLTGNKSLCIFCEKPHESDKCGKAQTMTNQEKSDMVKTKNGCLECLKRNHWVKNCKSFVKCLLCGKKHETIMCQELPKNKVAEIDNVHYLNANFVESSTVYFGTFWSTI